MPGGRDGVLADNSLPAPATVGANLRNLNSDILGEIIAAVVALSCIVRALKYTVGTLRVVLSATALSVPYVRHRLQDSFLHSSHEVSHSISIPRC